RKSVSRSSPVALFAGRSRSSIGYGEAESTAVHTHPFLELCLLACPDCATARVVRSSVFDQHFWTNLYLISLPLLVLAVISALLYPIGIQRRRSTGAQAEREETSS